MTNINDYNSIPTTPYREFVDKLEERIKYVNGLSYPDNDRLSILRGALLSLLEINPDNIIELSEEDDNITWEDDDGYP
jgi:hypothetical protein